MPGLSPKLPVTRDPDDGFSLTKTYKELAMQNFKNLVLTSPGERIMDPEFGVGLKRYLFQPISQFTFDDIAERIHQQVDTYMPFLKIIDIFFDTPSGEEFENSLGVRIEYFITPINTFSTLDLVYDGNISDSLG